MQSVLQQTTRSAPSRLVTTEVSADARESLSFYRDTSFDTLQRGSGCDPGVFLASIDPRQWIPRILSIYQGQSIVGFICAKERKVLGLRSGLDLRGRHSEPDGRRRAGNGRGSFRGRCEAFSIQLSNSWTAAGASTRRARTERDSTNRGTRAGGCAIPAGTVSYRAASG